MLATAFLDAPQNAQTGPVVVLYGDDRYLKLESLAAVSRIVLGENADELSTARLSGPTAEWRTVADRLLTVSMWSPRQLVIVEEADEFVTRFRAELERYLDRPAKKSVLVLDVASWPSTTRLAKKAEKIGLPLDCKPLAGALLVSRLRQMCETRHRKKLDRSAAELLVELAGGDLGLLDQELAKLAAFVGAAAAITPEAVEKLVGGWKAETTWVMLDAVRDGRYPVALELLEKLLTAGEHPLKLLGGVNFVFRPIARAVTLSRSGGSLEQALKDSGVKPFAVRQAEQYLRRMKRARAERILDWLLQADLDVKGASSLEGQAVLERLFVRLSGAAGV
jgi:DNA polymerase III subunit delta